MFLYDNVLAVKGFLTSRILPNKEVKRKDGNNMLPKLSEMTGAQKVVFGLGGLVVLAVLGPLAALAAMTVTNLATAALYGVGIFAVVVFMPTISRSLKTAALKLAKANAKRNPVETLQLELISRKEAFDAAGTKVVAINARCTSLREKLDEYKTKHGQSDESLEKMYNKLADLAGRLKVSLRQTNEGLEKFEDFVERQADRWEIAKDTGELAALLRETQGGDVTDKFLANTAIESIRNEMNLSFSAIDQILEGEEVRALVQAEPKLLPAPHDQILNTFTVADKAKA